MVWTVNDPLQMMEAVRWKVSAIITDKPKDWIDLRARIAGKASLQSNSKFRLSTSQKTTNHRPNMDVLSCGPLRFTTGRHTYSLGI